MTFSIFKEFGLFSTPRIKLGFGFEEMRDSGSWLRTWMEFQMVIIVWPGGLKAACCSFIAAWYRTSIYDGLEFQMVLSVMPQSSLVPRRSEVLDRCTGIYRLMLRPQWEFQMTLLLEHLYNISTLSLYQQSGYYDRGTLLRHGIVWEF